MIRKASTDDLRAVAGIYDEIHSREEQGLSSIGWIRGIYPTEETARNAIESGDLFVETVDGRVIGAAIINQKQVDVYSNGNWQHPATDSFCYLPCHIEGVACKTVADYRDIHIIHRTPVLKRSLRRSLRQVMHSYRDPLRRNGRQATKRISQQQPCLSSLL